MFIELNTSSKFSSKKIFTTTSSDVLIDKMLKNNYLEYFFTCTIAIASTS